MKNITSHLRGLPDFWPNKFKSKLPKDLKEWIYDQYFNQQILSVYCDASIKHDQSAIGIACSHVTNGSVLVKQKFFEPPPAYKSVPPIYAEMKSIIFALNNFEDYVFQCNNIIIYSDVKPCR